MTKTCPHISMTLHTFVILWNCSHAAFSQMLLAFREKQQADCGQLFVPKPVLTFPDVVRSGYRCSSEVLIAFQTASTPVLTLILRKQQHSRVVDFKLNTAKDPCMLYILKLLSIIRTVMCGGRQKFISPVSGPPWTCSRHQWLGRWLDFQKIQQGKSWQKVLFLSFLCEEMRYNQETLTAIS